MMNIKRGKILIFNNRKGISHDLFFNVFELILAFIVILALFNFIGDIAELTLFKRNYLARDISLLVNALYAAPEKVDYTYREDMSKLRLVLSGGRISFYEKDQEDDVEAFYFFGENTKAAFGPYAIITYGEEATTLDFTKSIEYLHVEVTGELDVKWGS